jgi:ketosteroid isomerase-like protein
MRVPALVPLLLIALTPSLVAQTSHSPDIFTVRQSINAGNAAYIAAFKNADAKALSQVYDFRGARLNEGGVVVRGRKAIQDDVGKFVATVGPVRVTLETKEVWLIDDNAYETGLWSYTFQPQGKPSSTLAVTTSRCGKNSPTAAGRSGQTWVCRGLRNCGQR